MSALRETRDAGVGTCTRDGCDGNRAILVIEGRRKRAKVCVKCLPRKLRRHVVKGKQSKKIKHSKNICGARKSNGTICRAGAGQGTDHVGFGRCKHHGGSSPNGKLAAAKQEAMDVVGGMPIDVDPQTALLTLVRAAAGHVAYWTARVHQLRHDEAYAEIVNRHRRPLDLGKYGEDDRTMVEEIKTLAPALHIALVALGQAEDRCARFAKMAIEAKVDEAIVESAKTYGGSIARAFEMAFSDPALNLTDEQHRVLPEVIDRAIKSLEGSTVEGTVIE